MAITLFLYTRPWVRIELVSLGLVTLLLAMFYIFPFSGKNGHISDVDVLAVFGHPALVAICCLMILGRGLTLTGALEPAVRLLARLWKWNPSAGLLVTLAFAATASAFVNDTPVMILMLPLLLGIAERTGSAASKVMMPVNFAILCGGMLTSIGTSTNILVLSIATDLGLPPMGIFAFTPIAAGAVLIAIPYLWLIAPRLLPAHARAGSSVERKYEARLMADNGGRLVGISVATLATKMGRVLSVLRIQRGLDVIVASPDTVFQSGDGVVVADTPEGLRELAVVCGQPLIDRETLKHFVADAESRIDQKLAELVVTADSSLVGRTLGGAGFTEEHGIAVVGVYRANELEQRHATDNSSVVIQAADVLLVQGRDDRIAAMRGKRGLLLIDSTLLIPRTPKAPWALAIMTVVIVLAALKIVPIHIAALLGVGAMLLTGCVLIEGLGRALSLEVVLLVASSVALGQSLVVTGGADWIASGVAVAIRDFPPSGQLAAFMVFAALLTNFVSNSAAAAIGTPIAMSMASLLGIPAQPFVLAVLFGANLSFATPMAYQTNLLVMNAAGYSFRDFVRVGTPLVILMVVALSVLLARHYGL
ncbi:MAG: SLC13 family permease [Steroidobacteraceae bacterium]